MWQPKQPASEVVATLSLRFTGVVIANHLLARHSRAGGNPAKTNTPQSGQNRNIVLLRGTLFD
jgi:hypothetical protein